MNRRAADPAETRQTRAKPSLFDVEAATKEIEAKSIDEIERATAITWGGRACAAFRMAAECDDMDERHRWLMDGENYRQESIEHAAMTGDIAFIQKVFDACDEERKLAMEDTS